MASARRRGKPPAGRDIVVWGACVLSLLIFAFSSALVEATTTTTNNGAVGTAATTTSEACPWKASGCATTRGTTRCTNPSGARSSTPGSGAPRTAGRTASTPGGGGVRHAARLLETLRNRRLVFVGDSIGRNQWESMLSAAVADVEGGSSVYEENGNPITKHRGFLSFRFRDHSCTVEHFRSPYLVRRGRPPGRVQSALQLAAMDARAPMSWCSTRGTGGTSKGCGNSKCRLLHNRANYFLLISVDDIFICWKEDAASRTARS
jgi:hypothetical protein